MPGTTPQPMTNDSLVWTFIVTNDIRTVTPAVDDYIFMSSNAPFTDAAPLPNKPEEAVKLVVGIDSRPDIVDSWIFIPVEGVDPNNPKRLITSGITSGQNVKLGRDMKYISYQDTVDGSIIEKQEWIQEWIPPAGLLSTGKLEPRPSECSAEQPEEKGIHRYPQNCLSTVQVFSKGKYTAHAAIFDNVGKYITHFSQSFGNCGETQNSRRRTPLGLVSWLVWDQKDVTGKLVKTGVYIWKVKFETEGGVNKDYYRQGIVRNIDPTPDCAEPTPME